MVDRLIDMATKIKPVSAADAPASTDKHVPLHMSKTRDQREHDEVRRDARGQSQHGGRRYGLGQANSSPLALAALCRGSGRSAAKARNVPLYPDFQAFFRKYQPPTLIAWGKNDYIFPAEGAAPYNRDLSDVETHLLDTGHFALETHGEEIASRIEKFFAQRA
jgi:pimeloyl-ACP methyl ester carboxylesterase